MKKKIGILGSGSVAKSLADGFIKNGYELMMGSRDIFKLTDYEGKAKTGSFFATAEWADIIVLACKGTAAEEVLGMAGIKNMDNKTVIDTTNPLRDEPPENGVLKFFTSPDDSLMERLQRIAPNVNFVKCFNIVGSALMVDPVFEEGKPTMFICGNNSEAKDEVKIILNEFGWEIEDMGKAESARAIEPLCILWCIPGILENRWTHAFKLLKK
ncbi:MAG: NAD(P)-binding domain-containing protein [Ignavibacteria bacterium]